MSLDLPKDHQLRYLNRRAVDIEEIRLGLKTNNFEAAKLIGHRLKGSGQTFGFPIISTLGNTIELAGHASDKKVIAEAVEELSVCIKDYLLQLSKE